MRSEARIDIAVAAGLALALSPLFSLAAAARDGRGLAGWCGSAGQRDGAPVGDKAAGCHACLCPRRDGEEEDAA